MNDEGFDEFLAAQQPRILAALTLLSGDPEVASEATREAFVRVLEQWRKVRAMASPELWVYRVAFGLLRRTSRRAALERRLRLHHASESGITGRPGQLWELIRDLPERERRVAVLRYVANLPEETIAHATGFRPSSVASILARLDALLTGRAVDADPAPAPRVEETDQRAASLSLEFPHA